MNTLLIRCTCGGRELVRFAAVAVTAAVPAMVLLVLAVASGLVRTALLGVFALVVGLRAAMWGLERAGALLPTPGPRLGGEPA